MYRIILYDVFSFVIWLTLTFKGFVFITFVKWISMWHWHCAFIAYVTSIFKTKDTYLSAIQLYMTKLVYVKFVSASAPCTHARTSEKNLIILQCNTEHKKVFLHIPGLKNTQIKIPRNVVDDVGTCIFVNMAFNLTLS